VESTGPLNDLRVLDCSAGVPGAYCAKLLADLGADVLKAEPPGGDVTRRLGPFPGDAPHPEKSGLFLYLNPNKRGVTLDSHTPGGRAILRRLAERVDILIEDHPPDEAARRGLGFDALSEVNPELILTSVSPFGQIGPYRAWTITDLIAFHMGGSGYETPQHGVASLEEPPLRAGGYQADYLAGVVGAAATMGGVFARRNSGRGLHVDVSRWESLVGIMTRINLHQWTYEGEEPDRRMSTERLQNHVPCKDGYINLLIYEPHWWRNLVEAMGTPEWTQDPLFQNADFRAQGWDAVQPLIEAWAMDYTKDELFRKLQAAHVPCLPGNTFGDLLESRHLRARGFFVEQEHPAAGSVVAPGPPYRLQASPWSLRRPAPLLGQHNVEVLCGELGYSREELARLRAWGMV